jgi:hypothetical protein
VFIHLGGSFDCVFTFEDSMTNVNKNESNTFFKNPLMSNEDKEYHDLLEFLILQ